MKNYDKFLISADFIFPLDRVSIRGPREAQKADAPITHARPPIPHLSDPVGSKKLNGGDVDRLIAGKKLRVLDHPRFSLVVHRRTRTADLSLNGKFFKRYYLTGDVKGNVGAYEVPERTRQIWQEKGIPLKPGDRTELEMLLARGASVIIAEL